MANQTGPTSITGKAASCLNHLTHAGASQTLFLKDENPDQFFALLQNSFEHYQPTTDEDAFLVSDSVLARWFLLRRQRTFANYESTLHERRPDPNLWIDSDLHSLDLLDRYKTQAERALKRALTNVHAIKKDALSEQHWQHQHELQKQRFALERERFELAKLKEIRLAAAKQEPVPEAAPPEDLPLPARAETGIHQTLYIGYEHGITTIYEITPSNSHIRGKISDSGQVIRTYNFVGGVPSRI